jgi:hypothetical protein
MLILTFVAKVNLIFLPQGARHAVNQSSSSMVDTIGRDECAKEALEDARGLPKGPERSEALKNASKLRMTADAAGILFKKRGRPRK